MFFKEHCTCRFVHFVCCLRAKVISNEAPCHRSACNLELHTSHEVAWKLVLQPPASGGDLKNLFKKPAGSWECEVCMVQNKAEAEQCVACTTPKPGPKSEVRIKTLGSVVFKHDRVPTRSGKPGNLSRPLPVRENDNFSLAQLPNRDPR